MDFNYYGTDYIRFEQDFLAVYAGKEPLFSITDDLLRAMSVDNPYFRLPPLQAKDGRRHVFYFYIKCDRYEYSHKE